MARLRPVRSFLTTLLVGGLLGFLVPSFVAGLSGPSAAAPSTGEAPAARLFIVALLSNDQTTLRQVSIQPSDAIEAARLGVTDAKVTSLTFLGSSVAGGFRVNSYAAEFTSADGSTVLRGFRVATIGRYALLADPPEPMPT
jgi:hypothetical protein